MDMIDNRRCDSMPNETWIVVPIDTVQDIHIVWYSSSDKQEVERPMVYR